MIIFNRNEIVEFKLDKFNDSGMDTAFGRIVYIYDTILHKDPLWHYFYEGHYSLIRCSRKYMHKVEKNLIKNGIDYRDPIVWEEGLYVTKKYQHIYQHIFHYTSVLAIELYKKGDCNYYVSYYTSLL